MSERLIIDGNAVYEIDEDCMMQQGMRRRGTRQRRRQPDWQSAELAGGQKTGKEPSK